MFGKVSLNIHCDAQCDEMVILELDRDLLFSGWTVMALIDEMVSMGWIFSGYRGGEKHYCSKACHKKANKMEKHRRKEYGVHKSHWGYLL